MPPHLLRQHVWSVVKVVRLSICLGTVAVRVGDLCKLLHSAIQIYQPGQAFGSARIPIYRDFWAEDS